jgi:putative transposase
MQRGYDIPRSTVVSACRMDAIDSVACSSGTAIALTRPPFSVRRWPKAFGCARVVYNDALAERRRAFQAGERISDTEIQRRVITQAKRTPERAWLAEVASVALVQACQAARRAHRNRVDSLTGKRKGCRVGRPRFREPDGRYYASFVVERDPSPLPPVSRTAGIDLGLIWFATIAASDGTIETLANPRHLRAAERRLARAQRQLSRTQRESKNRAKARLRVAVAHRRVRDQRADHHHKLTLRLIRENQAIAVEDLAVAGLARTRLAKSVHDAGWTMFIRLLDAKAAQHGRRVVKIGRWVPTSQICSACGHATAPSRFTSAPGCARRAGRARTETVTRPAISLSPPGWRRRKMPVAAMSDQERPWPWPAKQEPTEVLCEPSGAHAARQVSPPFRAGRRPTPPLYC